LGVLAGNNTRTVLTRNISSAFMRLVSAMHQGYSRPRRIA
jgi:hypothetical protein